MPDPARDVQELIDAVGALDQAYDDLCRVRRVMGRSANPEAYSRDEAREIAEVRTAYERALDIAKALPYDWRP